MSRAPNEHLTDDELKHLLEEVSDSTTAAASAYGPELRAALHELGQLRGQFPCRSGIMVHESVSLPHEGRTLVAELEARGYDLTTLRFQIRKKATR